MADPAARRWLIGGRVQGVGYRAWMVGQARALGIDGWVRNLPDGRVEAAVLGGSALLERLHHACLQGPRHARVGGIEVLPGTPDLIRPGSGFHEASDAD